MLQCGGCLVEQTVPILLNPVTWLVALAAITTAFNSVTGKKK